MKIWPPTEESLRERALKYLSRFASSRANLRRVLLRQCKRYIQKNALEQTDQQWVLLDQMIARLSDDLERIGLLNDQEYANTKTRSLRRRGGSRRKIKAKLQEKGISTDVIDNAILSHSEGQQARAELEAAITLAKRRRIGPFRKQDRRDFRQKDMAILARAGFSYEVAIKIIGLDDAADIPHSLSDWT